MFKVGDPKPPGSGRKKGQKTRRQIATDARLKEILEGQGVNVEIALAKAIKKGDVQLIRALQGLLPYLQPRLATEVPRQATSSTPEADLTANTTDLLALVTK